MSQQADVVSRQTPVFVVTLVTAILATITVAARLTSRFGIVRRATRDDYLIICAWIVATGLSFSVCYGTSKGLGLKDADINTAWFPALRRAEYSFSVLYNVALVLTKSSILTFYLRLSRNTNKLLRIASWLTLGVVVLAGTVLTFLNVFQCTPIGAVFDPDVNPNAKCFSIVTLYLCSAPVNIITDLAILVLPLPVLTSMRLPGKQKTILIATFALGVFVIVVDVVRIFYLQQSATSVAIGTMSQSRIGGQLDFAWNASLALMWSAVEVNVGIICANIPTLKPLIKRILPSMITDYPSHESSDTEKTSSFTSQAPLDANRHSIRLSPIAAEEHAPGSIRPLPPAQLGGNQEQEIGLMDFLTAPESMGVTSTQTHRTGATDNPVYFGFVNMNGPKSMLKYNLRESFKSCSYVTTLFFLWGFSYGILNTLNNQISKVARTTTGQTLGLESMYFAGYLIGPLTAARYILQRWGFKATFITGLCIYGVGTLMFWPSAVLTSYPGFILSNFVVGIGLSILETAANPFLALCGSEQYSEVRLLIAQGVQAVGSIASQVLAEKVLFRGARSIANNPSLIDVQWTYLAIALFSVVLAVIFFYIPLPEASDSDLRELAENLGIHSSEKFSVPKLPVVYTTLALAVLAQFFYVGAQQGASFYFQGILVHLASTTGISLTISPISYSTLSLVTFASGRFLAAALCYIITPRILLLVIFIGGILSSSLIVGLGSVSPNIVAAPALIFFFFEGPVFPMLFAIGLRGLGHRTKAGAAYLTAAVSGGAVFPLVMYAIQHHNHQTIQMSFCVIIALFATCLLFSVYLNASSKVRHQVDPRIATRSDDERPLTPIRRLSKQFQSLVLGKQRKGSADLPVVEHRERRSWASGATKP